MQLIAVSSDGTAFTTNSCCNSNGDVEHVYTPPAGYILVDEAQGAPGARSSGSVSDGGQFCLLNGSFPQVGCSCTEYWASRYPYVTEHLGGLSLIHPGVQAGDISDDGSVVVGWSYADSGQSHAFRWTLAGGTLDLGLARVDDQSSSPMAVSGDGSTVVGVSTGSAGMTLFRWTGGTGMVALTTLPTDPNRHLVSAGAESSTFLGYNIVGGHAVPFRWTPAAGMQNLPLVAGRPDATPTGVSADGTRVVGFLQSPTYTGDDARAFLWSPSIGAVELEPYLRGMGVPFPGPPSVFFLNVATSISRDGAHIGGNCASSTPQRVWIVHLAPARICGSADFNCDGDVGTDQDIDAFFACLSGTCPAAPCTNSADFNGDGDVGTDADIDAFFRVLAGGSC